jgi:hypothetical protein
MGQWVLRGLNPPFPGGTRACATHYTPSESEKSRLLIRVGGHQSTVYQTEVYRLILGRVQALKLNVLLELLGDPRQDSGQILGVRIPRV